MDIKMSNGGIFLLQPTGSFFHHPRMGDEFVETSTAAHNAVTKRFKQWKPFPKGGMFPLKWSLWVDEFNKTTHKPGMSQTQFAQSLEKRGDFENMDQLCEIWNKNTDERGYPHPDCNLFVFVEGIVPTWEDPANRLGGHWVCKILRNEKKAEQLWYSLLMTIVCGQFPGRYYQEINGIVISPRGNEVRVYVWNKHSLNAKYKESMSSFICDTLDISPQFMRYNTHKHKVYTNKVKTTKKKKKNKNNHSDEEHSGDEEDHHHDMDREDDEYTNDHEQHEESLISELSSLVPPDFDPSLEPVQSPDQEQAYHPDDHPAAADREPSSPAHSPYPQSHPTPPVMPSAPVPTKSSSIISPFSLSVGLAIFLALMYNIYILLG